MDAPSTSSSDKHPSILPRLPWWYVLPFVLLIIIFIPALVIILLTGQQIFKGPPTFQSSPVVNPSPSPDSTTGSPVDRDRISKCQPNLDPCDPDSCDYQPAKCTFRCNLVPKAGPCEAAFPKYYFDHQTQSCQQFLWGGCQGVVPFNTLEQCQQTCEQPRSSDHQSLCEQLGGQWLDQYQECENIKDQDCTQILGGTYDSCASACRHQPSTRACIQVCVPVCSLAD